MRHILAPVATLILSALILTALILTALILTALPLWADDSPNLDPLAPAQPGAVALYLQAANLAALGQTAKDPLLILTAVRILHGLALTDTPRTPDPAPDAALPLTPLDPARLLETAQTLDAGEVYSDLTYDLAAEANPQPKALRATAATLAPGATAVWTLSFYGGAFAEVALLDHENGNLDLLVTDSKSEQICRDRGNTATAYCGFTPLENGTFSVTVTNMGEQAQTYMILTN